MKIEKIVIIAVSILIILLVFLGIYKIIDFLKKDYTSPEVTDFNYYKVYVGNKYGVINKEGKLVVSAQYDDVIIPNPLKDVFICKYNYNSLTKQYDYKILNEKNEELYKQYNNIEAIAVTGIIGKVPYEKWVLKYSENNLYGLISIDGKQIANAKYEEISSIPYKEGVLLVKEKGKYGVINNKGVIIINSEYDNIIGDGFYDEKSEYKLSCYIVKKDDKYGYIDNMGKTILKNEYDSILRLKTDKDNYLIVKKNYKVGILKEAKLLVDFTYDDIVYNEAAELFIVNRNQKYGVLNRNGKELVKNSFDNIVIDGIYIIASRNNVVENYTLEGKKVENNLYVSVDKVSDDFYISKNQNNNYGILNKSMEVILENNYEYLGYAFDNLFIARSINGKYGIIDMKTKNMSDFNYDAIQAFDNIKLIEAISLRTNILDLYNQEMVKIFSDKNAETVVYDNYLRVYGNTKIIYFDINGKEVDSSKIYPNNELLVYIENGKSGFKNRNGDIIVQAKYDLATELNENGFAGIKSNDKWGIIDKTGKIIVEPKYTINNKLSELDFLGEYYKQSSYYTNFEI